MGKDLYELSNGWVWATVNEIIQIIDYRGRTPPFAESGIPHLRSSNIKNMKIVWEGLAFVSEETYQKYMTRGIPQKGDVLFTTEAPLGEVALAPELKFSLAQRMMILRPTESVVLPKFLLYQIASEEFQGRLKGKGTGTTVQGISSRNFKPFKILVASLPEQYRIVAKIEELFTQLDAGVELLKKVKAKLKRYRQTVLKAAVEGNLTAYWRTAHQGELEPASVLLERILKQRRDKWEAEQLAKMQAQGKTPKDDSWKLKYKEAIAPDTSELPELPDGWCYISVEQVVDVGTGATPLKSNLKYYQSGSIPWVTSGALNQEVITEAEEYITELAIQETNAKVFPKYTLLVAMYGEGKTRGKVSELLINAATNQACAALIFDDYSLQFKSYFKLFFLKNYDDIRRLSSGGVQPNLNLGIIKITIIPLPSANEQLKIIEEIERIFSVTDQLEKTINTNLKRAERLRQSILKQAFTGQLVPQDPSDEPAEKLLERIKAEKAKQVTTKAKKKTKSQPQSSAQLALPLE